MASVNDRREEGLRDRRRRGGRMEEGRSAGQLSPHPAERQKGTRKLHLISKQ